MAIDVGKGEGEVVFSVNVAAGKRKVRVNYASGVYWRMIYSVQVNNQEPHHFIGAHTGTWYTNLTHQDMELEFADGLNEVRIFFDMGPKEIVRYMYSRMSHEVSKLDREVIFAVGKQGSFEPYVWGSEVSNQWRTSQDLITSAGKTSW